MTQEEAIKILKDFHDESALFSVRTALETLYPEFKESEGEKVRKALIEMVHDTTCDSFWVDYNVHKEEILTWLEKQGETYTKKDVDNAYIEGMVCAKNELEKQGEQKPTWSEEDEERLSDAIFFVREYQIPTRDKRLLNAAKEAEDWLKSLKTRHTWKPSDEQMEALDDFIYAKYPNIEKYGAAVKSLYQDLKKLREE